MNDGLIVEYLRDAYKYAYMFSDDPSTKNGSILICENGVAYGCNRLPNEAALATVEHVQNCIAIYEQTLKAMGIYAPDTVSQAVDNSQLSYAHHRGVEEAYADYARAIIGAGIAEVIGYKQAFEPWSETWAESIELGNTMLKEAGVNLVYYNGIVGECVGVKNGKEWKP